MPGRAKSNPGREHYPTAQALARSGLYQAALGEIDIALSADSTKTSYHNMRGYCLEHLRRYDEAIQSFNHALFLDPHNDYAHRHLVTCEESKKTDDKANRALGETVKPELAGPESDRWLGLTEKQVTSYKSPGQNEFQASYWEGIKSLRAGKFEEAALSLAKAVELRPTDFDANFWRGMTLVRAGKFVEAIPNFEKAHEIRSDNKSVRLELFACYLVAHQNDKALAIYPIIVGATGGVLSLLYLIGLTLLLPFSIPKRTAVFPGLRFSIAWLALFFEGQFAFLLLLMLVPGLGTDGSIFLGLIVAAVPVIIVAATGFARQPWGEPFRWPGRIGTWKTIVDSLFSLLVLQAASICFSQLYIEIAHKPPPLQHIVPFIKRAMVTNPVIAWSAVVLVIPIVEEILFRGLIYGALEKRWGYKWAIFGSSFLFACVHFQLVGFLFVFLLGLILAWARYRTRSLTFPIVIHALNNGFAILVLAISGKI